MTSREIVRRIVRHQDAPRLAWDFLDPRYQDIRHIIPVRLTKPENAPYEAWAEYPDLRAKTGFHGELRVTPYGNILGRLGGRTMGECIVGALQEGWEGFDAYVFPTPDPAHTAQVQAKNYAADERYVLASLPVSMFSVLRDMRRMDNALMDVAGEPEAIVHFLERLMPLAKACVAAAADCGADGIIFADDWGMQFSPFISPDSFGKLFKPAYKQISEACRERNLDFFLHSCGCVLPLVDHMLEAGIEVFQFDQPEAAGCSLWAERYGDRATFYSPVDIQKIMPTGDRAIIEAGALHMAQCFQANGSLIAKDYGSIADLNIEREWVGWATEVIVANSARK